MNLPPVTMPAVYTLTHRPTGKFYIGSTKNMYVRFMLHKSKLVNGNHENKNIRAIHTCWEDYDIQFTYCKTKLVAIEEEQRMLTLHNGNPLLCNVAKNATPSWLVNGAVKAASDFWKDETRSKEARKKISEALLGRKKPPGFIGGNHKPVETDGLQFKNAKHAAEHHGISYSAMRRRLNGRTKGYPTWKYTD